MHVMIRRYSMAGSMDDLMDTVATHYAAQFAPGHRWNSSDATVPLPSGILSYQAVRTGPQSLVTITTFESEADLTRAQTAAAAIRHSLGAFDVEEEDTIYGEVDICYLSPAMCSLQPSR